jgi:tRNA threonylcarbamoyladenosine biosynthesis protein TsaB
VLAAVDARLGELYWAVYEPAGRRVRGADPPGWREIAAPALARRTELAALCERFLPETVALDSAAFEACAASVQWPGAELLVVGVTASALLPPALHLIDHGGAVPAVQAAPLYVRDRVALTIIERQAAAAPAP